MLNASNINTNTQYTVQRPKIKRRYSALKYGYSQMGTNNVGVTYPFFIRELTPSDKASFQTNINLQFSPFVSQLFSRMTNEISGYKLPYRVCCEKLSDYYKNYKFNWDDFSTGGSDGQDIHTLPTVYNLSSLLYRSLIGFSYSNNLGLDIKDCSLFSDFFERIEFSPEQYFIYKKDCGLYPLSVVDLPIFLNGADVLFTGTIFIPRFGVYLNTTESFFRIFVFNPDHIDRLINDTSKLNNYLRDGSSVDPALTFNNSVSLGDSLTSLFSNFLNGTLWDSFGLPMPDFGPVTALTDTSDTYGFNVEPGNFLFPFHLVGTAVISSTSESYYYDSWIPLMKTSSETFKFYHLWRLGFEDMESLNRLLLDLSKWDDLQIGVNAMPFIMYNLIYNDVLRFPDLEHSRDLFNIFPFRGHEQNNYFTRARIFQQRGVSPMIPVDVRVGLSGGGSSLDTDVDSPFNLRFDDDGSILSIDGHNIAFDRSSFDIDDMLQGLLLMRYQVNNAKMRSRYIDHLRYRFGVDGLDARLQLPEYLGSFYQDVYQTNVVQTAPSVNGSTGLGTITSVASVSANNGVFTTEAKEHEIIMFLSVCRPDMVIEQGIPKWLTKKNRFDFVIPELVDSPDVPIKKYELIGKAMTHSSQYGHHADKVFGWTSIYDEYRTSLNQVVGRLRPSDKLGLRSFTLSRLYDFDVELNGSFVQIPNVMNRVKQYVNEPDFIYSASVVASTAQPLPIESEPGQFVDI